MRVHTLPLHEVNGLLEFRGTVTKLKHPMDKEQVPFALTLLLKRHRTASLQEQVDNVLPRIHQALHIGVGVFLMAARVDVEEGVGGGGLQVGRV